MVDVGTRVMLKELKIFNVSAGEPTIYDMNCNILGDRVVCKLKAKSLAEIRFRGNSGKSEPGLSVFTGFCRIPQFYRHRASIPLRPFAVRTGATLPA